MTGQEIKDLSTSILDGLEIDDDFYYQLLNIAKTKLEGQRLWQYLKKLDSSHTASSVAIALPTDCAEDYKVTVGLNNEYLPVPFEEQNIVRSNRYYIDWAANTIKLLGANIPSQTLYFFYKKTTPEITSITEPVFPERFHPLLAYYVAAHYQGDIDSDDIFARMSPGNKLAAVELERSMKIWDSGIAMRAQNNQIGVADNYAETPLEQM